jgi:hypothetical protein
MITPPGTNLDTPVDISDFSEQMKISQEKIQIGAKKREG